MGEREEGVRDETGPTENGLQKAERTKTVHRSVSKICTGTHVFESVDKTARAAYETNSFKIQN